MASSKDRKKKKASRPLWRRIVGATFYLLFLAAVLAVSSVAGWVTSSPLASAFVDQVLHPKEPEQVFGGKDYQNLLILGCDVTIDGRTKRVISDRARADMMLVARLDFRNNVISGVSIPRDTLASVPGYRTRKINGFHAIGDDAREGADLTRRAVERILPGIEIDRVITLDYDAFKRMVDLTGGVTIDVKKPMRYHDNAGGLHIDLAPGLQKLDGYQAMGFVRFRHSDSDFERQERQKAFMVAFKQALMQNPTAFMAVLNESMNVVGGALTPEELASIAMFAKDVPSDRIKMGQIPVRNGRGTNLRVDREKIRETLQQYNMYGDAYEPDRVSHL